MDSPRSQSLGGWMAFTLFIAAAYSESTGIQREELRRHLSPVLRQLKEKDLTTEQVRYLVGTAMRYTQVIMGPDWRPKGEWKSAIDSMLGKKS